MSKLLAVAARELRERWLLFPGGLAVGFIPLVLPAFGVRREHAPGLGLAFAILFGIAAAVVIGSSMLARDAANGRLGFLFSRPVSWRIVWGGKWLAALVLVAASGLLAAIPWMAVFPPEAHGGSWLRTMADAPGSAFFLVLLFLAVGIANFNAIALRSRSAWLAVDLVLLLAGLWAAWRYLAPLWKYGIFALDEWGVTLGLLPLAFALLVGSVAQVAVGRTDVRRAHRALSLGFWAVMALTLATAAGYWRWARSAGPAEINAFAVSRDPAGRWVYVEGHARRSGWYPHGFLIDITSGRYMTRPVSSAEWGHFSLGMLFSADGGFAALPFSDGQSAVFLFDLRDATPRVTRVVLGSSPPSTWSTAFALSPDATSVFMVHESGASLFALPSGRRVATTTIPPGWRPAAARLPAEGPARAWLVPSREGALALRPRPEMRVVDLDARGQSKAVTFQTATSLDQTQGWGPLGWGAVVPDPDGRRIVTVDAGVHLRDGATGQLIASLVDGAGRFAVIFLADGRIVVGCGRVGTGQPGPPHAQLLLFDTTGTKVDVMDIPDAWTLTVGPEVAPGRVAVSSFRSPFLPEDTLIVDLSERRVVQRLPGLRPAIGFWNVSSAVPAGAGLASAHLFRDFEGRVVRIDFATGERKIVAGPGATRGQRLKPH